MHRFQRRVGELVEKPHRARRGHGILSASLNALVTCHHSKARFASAQTQQFVPAVSHHVDPGANVSLATLSSRFFLLIADSTAGDR